MELGSLFFIIFFYGIYAIIIFLIFYIIIGYIKKGSKKDEQPKGH